MEKIIARNQYEYNQNKHKNVIPNAKKVVDEVMNSIRKRPELYKQRLIARSKQDRYLCTGHFWLRRKNLDIPLDMSETLFVTEIRKYMSKYKEELAALFDHSNAHLCLRETIGDCSTYYIYLSLEPKQLSATY